jgi:hypothetical protein
MRKMVLFADWHGIHASNVVVTEDLLVDCFLSHVWRDPFPSKKFKDIVKSPELEESLSLFLSHMSGLFSSVEFGASLFDRAEMFNRRDEHLWIAKSVLEVSKLGRFLEGNGQVSRAASIPTWKGPICEG